VAFEDARENENHNYLVLYAIPLMPFGWQNLNTPELTTYHTTTGVWNNYKPTEDFPKALAEDLRNTHLFADAFFDFRRDTADYAVQGKILSTKYTGRIISYGLSVEGPLLWLIGFPAAWTQNELSIDLTLMDSKTGNILFSKNYTATPCSNMSWLYYMKDDYYYPEMMAEVNKQFCTDIQPIVLKDSLKATEPKNP
jgi:hypothetical protein